MTFRKNISPDTSENLTINDWNNTFQIFISEVHRIKLVLGWVLYTN